METIIRRGIAAVALSFCALLVPACAPEGEPAQEEMPVLQVAYNQWAGFTPVFVAQESGFFRDAGVQVELVAFPGPGNSLAPLAAGQLDLSLTTPDNVILLNSTSDAGVKAVYLIDASDGADALVGNASIRTPAELRGKTIAVTEGEVNHLLLLKALEAGGLTEADVELVNMNPDDAGAAFVAGSVDAAVTWEPWVSQAVEAGGRKIFTSADAPNLLLDVVAATRRTITEKPGALQAFLAGLEQGVRFTREQPDSAYALAGKWLDVTGPEVGAMLGGVKLYSAVEQRAILGGEEPGGFLSSLESIGTFLVTQKKIPARKPASEMIDAQFAS